MTWEPFQIVLRDEAEVFLFVCAATRAQEMLHVVAAVHWQGGEAFLSLASNSFLKALKREFS